MVRELNMARPAAKKSIQSVQSPKGPKPRLVTKVKPVFRKTSLPAKGCRLKDVLASPHTAIVLIDVQPDFMEGGPLAVGGADYSGYVLEAQQFMDKCRAQGKLYVTQSQDFHPPGHVSFASTNNQEPMSLCTITLPNGEPFEQVMWPDHCVQGTDGVKLLIEPKDGEFIQQKGINQAVDSYSAFLDAAKKCTGFTPHLRRKGIKNVVCLGVASDYCVNFSVTDSVAAGFKTYAVTDLCRAVDPQYDIVSEYTKKGVTCISTAECNAAFGDGVPRMKLVPHTLTVTPLERNKVRPIAMGAPRLSSSVKEVLNSPQTAIVLMDFQYDFMEGGPVAVPGADYTVYANAVRMFIERCRSQGKLHITQTQDWHPLRHGSFASAHRKTPMSAHPITLPNGESYDQILWPDHCVQSTDGAQLLIAPHENEFVQQKGTYWRYDCNSAFFDVTGKTTYFSTHLRSKKIKNVVVFGLSGDHSVNHTVVDAAKCGFKAFVVTDLCRCVDPSYDVAIEFAMKGVVPITTSDCYAVMSSNTGPVAQVKAFKAPRPLHTAGRPSKGIPKPVAA